MEPTDLTVKLLQELRNGQREQTAEIHELRGELHTQGERNDVRFVAIETTLRDLAQQMVMVGRALKVAVEARAHTENRLEDHEKRLQALETSSH